MLKILNIQSIALLVILGLVMMLSSCNTNKYLDDGERYVAKSKYKLQADQKTKNKGDILYDLSTLEQQKPNKKFLGLARMGLWQYNRLLEKPDSTKTKLDKWIAKVIAEQPSILDSLKTVKSAENMAINLKRRGYFDAAVDYEITKKKHTAYSKYKVDLKSLYTIDTAIIASKDTAVLALVNKNYNNSFLKEGAAVSYENYQKEHTRIRNILRNNGYARFQTNFITRFRGDSTLSDDHKVRIEYDIITPTDTTFHEKFIVGDITVIPEYTPDNEGLLNQDTTISGYNFKTDGAEMKVKPKVLLENIFLQKGRLYRQRDQDKTSLQLSNLGLYRFVTVKPVFDPNRPGIIDFEIYLTMNKKLALNLGAEINNTNRTATATSLVGTALSMNWRNRNLFKGAELLLFNIEGGLEIDPSSSNKLISNVNFSTEVNLQIPRFNDYFSFWKALGRKNKSEDDLGFYQKLVDNANSQFSARFNYVDLNNAYTFRSFEVSYGLNINNLNGQSWNINHFGIDYLVPTIDPDFEARAPEILKRSLRSQFITGLIFKEITKKTVKRFPTKDITRTVIFQGEQSGLEFFGIDKVFRNGSSPLQIGNSTLSKFLAGSVDASWVKRYSQSQSMAFHVFAGGVVPYGDSAVVPFVKQYNGGGANSFRAWRLFELGPGSYEDPLLTSGQDSINIIQTANLKLEANLEYRFDINGIFKSAFFVDAGNIWALEDDGREGAKFEPKNILSDLSISIGTGLRMDFTYFIFRVDIGFKFKTPYVNDSGNKYTPLKDYLKRENRYISIALGYPF